MLKVSEITWKTNVDTASYAIILRIFYLIMPHKKVLETTCKYVNNIIPPSIAMKGVMVSFHHLCGTLDPEAIPCKLTLSEVYHNR